MISEGLSTVDELIEKINIIFSGDSTDAVQLSTVHKAKGLEADNVFILKPSLMPLKYAKKDWEIKTEKNLIYVAYTRAKKTLNFIEEEKNTFGYGQNNAFDPSNMKNTINAMKLRLNFNSKEEIHKKLEQPKKLGEKKAVMPIVNSNKPNKKNAASKFAKILR